MFSILVIALVCSLGALAVMIHLIRREGVSWCFSVVEYSTDVELFSIDECSDVATDPAPVERRRYWRVRITYYYAVIVTIMLVVTGICVSLFTYPPLARNTDVINFNTETAMTVTTLPEQTYITNVPLCSEVLTEADPTGTREVLMGEATVPSIYDNIEIINT